MAYILLLNLLLTWQWDNSKCRHIILAYYHCECSL